RLRVRLQPRGAQAGPCGLHLSGVRGRQPRVREGVGEVPAAPAQVGARVPSPQTPPGRTRRRALAGATPLAVAAARVTILVAGRNGGERAGAPRSGAFTATVRRRNLVIAENATGKISYAGASTVANRLQGTLTWVPPVGRVIAPGHRLFDVDNYPVVL